MANTLNEWRGIGNLGRDPEIASFQNGDRVANISLACTDKYKNRNGEVRERTFWAKIKVTGRKVDLVERFLKKGDKVMFGGRLEDRQWEDRDGNKRHATDIVCDDFEGRMLFLSVPDRSNGGQGGGPAPQRQNGQKPSQSSGWDAPSGDLDDSIPF